MGIETTTLVNLAERLNVLDSIRALVSTLASVLKPVLTHVGITLPPAGYVIIAILIISVIIYHIQKMTVEMLKAVVVGTVIALILHILGII